MFDVLHTVINSVYVQTLPTEQATSVVTDFFSRGHDPFAHVCKARPLNIVGRTSLSVIVIVIGLIRRSFHEPLGGLAACREPLLHCLQILFREHNKRPVGLITRSVSTSWPNHRAHTLLLWRQLCPTRYLSHGCNMVVCCPTVCGSPHQSGTPVLSTLLHKVSPASLPPR